MSPRSRFAKKPTSTSSFSGLCALHKRRVLKPYPCSCIKTKRNSTNPHSHKISKAESLQFYCLSLYSKVCSFSLPHYCSGYCSCIFPLLSNYKSLNGHIHPQILPSFPSVCPWTDPSTDLLNSAMRRRIGQLKHDKRLINTQRVQMLSVVLTLFRYLYATLTLAQLSLFLLLYVDANMYMAILVRRHLFVLRCVSLLLL